LWPFVTLLQNSLFNSENQKTCVLMCFCMGKHMCLTFSIKKDHRVWLTDLAGFFVTFCDLVNFNTSQQAWIVSGGVALLHAGHKTSLMCTTVYLWCHNHLFCIRPGFTDETIFVLHVFGWGSLKLPSNL
jgi:hypothetical protein